MATITPELRAHIDRAIEAIPKANRTATIDGTVVADPTAAFHRGQDWAFICGYAFVRKSSNDVRVRFECIHHKQETRNTRNIAEEDRKRVSTYVKATGCKACLYVSRQKRRGY
jgi:hypothetical protein